ncbi:DoxX family protein [Mesobacterium sp. TK19101]|uniref:DoxX family protein n=1 Tax=Mesobacterium hydrothermale TaxID=3111907 RepID=A0ABU6HCD5_9RHOB|nr:DoxX family protein [Mesobacterium sp. TK19101]MEC3859931.1 DoxX family protein [Mesobacterium sp. TK19101]
MELISRLTRLLTKGDVLLPLLARFAFAATLLVYFWASAGTKIGRGLFGFVMPSSGAYAQIFPKQFEAVGYDPSQLGVFHWLVAVAGTWAEFVLPLLIVLGLMTRLAALGMIGFVTVQSLTDLYGHGGIAHAATLGAWFDRMPDAVILDQRLFWVFALTVLVVKGAGALSFDRVLARRIGIEAPRAPGAG